MCAGRHGYIYFITYLNMFVHRYMGSMMSVRGNMDQ